MRGSSKSASPFVAVRTTRPWMVVTGCPADRRLSRSPTSLTARIRRIQIRRVTGKLLRSVFPSRRGGSPAWAWCRRVLRSGHTTVLTADRVDVSPGALIPSGVCEVALSAGGPPCMATSRPGIPQGAQSPSAVGVGAGLAAAVDQAPTRAQRRRYTPSVAWPFGLRARRR